MAKVLIVDDAPLIVDRIALALTPLGHECIFAADGLEAIQTYLRERPAADYSGTFGYPIYQERINNSWDRSRRYS